jgi:predicted enzyme related to lactoylglutathione lyase
MGSVESETHPVFRLGGISYLRIPAPDPQRVAAFYRAVFDWKVDDDRKDPSFEDGTGHVIGHFVSDLPVAGEAGPTPYIFMERVADVLKKVTDSGGKIATEPYPEGDLWVATFTDPAGNHFGVWQLGPLD